MTQPYNAGQTIVVEQVSAMPIKDRDWGPITVHENWGRLFITWEDRQIIAVESHYPKLVAAIQHFIRPSAKTSVGAFIAKAAKGPELGTSIMGWVNSLMLEARELEVETDARLTAAYLAGWEVSGEGYNHECGGPDKPLEDKDWRAARDAALGRIK